MKKRKWQVVVFAFYMVVLLRITVFRSSFSLNGLMQRGTLNLTLFEEYLPLLQQGRWGRFLYLFVGNIIWFVPFGAFWCGIGKRREMGRILVSGFVLSLAIESMQFLFGTGVSELDDLVLNTFGTWLGAAGVKLYNKYKLAEAKHPA